jgi:small-conductance mechanosensitive channel
MVRPLALILIMLALITGGLHPAAAAAPTTPPTPAITQAQARQVLDVMNDPAKRAAFTATLEAIVNTLPSTPPPTPSTTKPPATTTPATTTALGLPIPLTPNSLGAQVLVRAAGLLNQTADQALRAVAAVQGLPTLGTWLASLLADPTNRGRLLDAAWRLALAVGCGLIAQWLIARALRAPATALETLAQPTPPGPPDRRWRTDTWALALRVPLLLLRIALGLVPVFAFLIAGHLLAGSAMGGEPLAQFVLLAVIDAYALCAAILGTARLILLSRLSLPIEATTAAYALRWLRRMVVVTAAGYAVAEVGLLFGLSDAAHRDLLNLVILFDHICLAVIVLQQREPVAAWIRAPAGATGTLASLRNGLAAAWHWIALTTLVALWLVRASAVAGGYTRILYLFAVTGAVLLLAGLIRAHALRRLDRALHIEPTMASLHPGLDARLHRYHPALHAAAEATVYLAAALALLQLWGLDAFGWLTSASGKQLVSTVVTLLVTLLLALLIWETTDAATERHLARLTTEGRNARAARLRTLLPMLRTTLMIVILLVVGLVVLSDIGVNIAPLLAGAGIVGLAIGFGSQKLVQDVITGIFLLLENAMQIGDWVTVAGLSGTVENLSVRTIRLRAGDGSVHVIPFSSVTSVTNTNRGLGNAAVSVSVAFGEDTDHVCEVLQSIATQMRQEPQFETQMLSDLQVWGMDKLDGSAATITGQIVCTDSGRWSVQREFNRRMKKQFQEQGIEIYNPLRMLVIDAPAAKPAPATE